MRVRVTVIVPCFNRPRDVDALMGDLESIDTSGLDVRMLIVDNGSAKPIAPPAEHPLPIEVVRLSVNTGGSGGYNAGMAYALHTSTPDLLWLVDSDARVEPNTLTTLVASLVQHDDLVAVGPLLCDPVSGDVHEIGGRVHRGSGVMMPALADVPAHTQAAGLCHQEIHACDYVAACCLLVRADAVRAHGVFPPIFLNGDDSAWCIRLARATGKFIGIEPQARAMHPRFDGFPTFARYYGARNALEPMQALGLGVWARFRRGIVETTRAVNLAMTGRGDLASLHIVGLRDAALGLTTGRGESPAFEPFGPMPEAAINAPRVESTGSVVHALPGLLRRMALGPPIKQAVVPAKGHPSTWLCARTVHLEDGGKCVTRELHRLPIIAFALWTLARGGLLSARLAVFPPSAAALPPVDVALACAPVHRDQKPTLSIIVLSYNRKDSLLETLDRLTAGETTTSAEIIVVDNASTDGSVGAVRDRHPSVRLIANANNELIEGFNIGVRAATGSLVLILDDDARPDQQSLREAIEALAERPELGGATLHPIHPKTGLGEWPFVRTMAGPTDAWPVMGCCNLVRRDLWLALGGYDARFGLYRNDVDMAMRLLSVGAGVRFDPSWTCEHDSPAAANKSVRWCGQATRNWVWLCRRHGGRFAWMVPVVIGLFAAHRHAGLRPGAHAAVFKGAAAGLASRPEMPAWWRRDPRTMRTLLRLRLRKQPKR